MSKRQMSNNQARSTRNGALAQNNRPNPKKSRRSRNRRGNVKSPVSQRPTLHLSQCAADYAKAKVAPFAYASNLNPCIPDLLDLPSQKFSTLMRGEAHLGTQGFGFVIVSPFSNTNSDAALWCSAATYATAQVPLGTGTGVSTLLDVQFPWGTSDPRNVRTVACGLRVRYTGTELNRGGRICLAQAKSATGSFGNSTFATILSNPEARSYPVDRSWRTISWNPGYPEAFEYTRDTYPLSTSSVTNGKLVAVMVGAPANTFEFEVITYHEAVSNGPNRPVMNVTKSHSDPVGLSLVKDYLSMSPDNVTAGSTEAPYRDFLKFAVKGAASVASSYFTGSPGPGLALAGTLL